jgi:RHS repeat-associated protein
MINGQWTATYDTLNRVSTATVAGTPSDTLTWSYDVFGNRKSQGPNGGQLSYPVPNNRISGYTYDASGDVLDDGSNQYGYDGEGRLCTVYNKTLVSYTGYAYDGLGNRVAKGTGMNSLSCDNNFTATSSFVVGPNGEQLDEMNATGAVYSNVFANGRLLATYQFPTANWTFALNDWLGTKRAVANADGTQAEKCTGLPFGDGLNCTGTGDPSPQHFTGKERDTESNNDYFGARYYSSNTGRFLSPDWSSDPDPVPYADLENPQSLNLYGYVNNNPLSKTDADGHFMLVGTQQCWCEQAASDLMGLWYHIQWNWQNNPNIWDRAYWSKSNKPAPPPPVVTTPAQTANPNPDDNKKKDDKPKRVSNQKHHPNSSSPEPKNVQELYDKAIKDSNGRWWAKDADGVIHRFSRPSNGETHWNGSTTGPDPIRMSDIPNEIRNALK